MAPFILHVALKLAPGSTDNFPVSTSPSITDDALSDNISETYIFPETLPSISWSST